MPRRRRQRKWLRRKDLISSPMNKLDWRKSKEMLFCKLKEMKNLQSLKLIEMPLSPGLLKLKRNTILLQQRDNESLMRKPRSKLICWNLRLPHPELKRLKMMLFSSKRRLKRLPKSGKDKLPLPRKSLPKI